MIQALEDGIALGLANRSILKLQFNTMARSKTGIFGVILLFCARLCTVNGMEAELRCMTAFNEGGAPSVFQSLECAQWVRLVESLKNSTGDCQFASLQGHREYQEDRVICNLDMLIPFVGKDVLKEAKVDLLAVFDGHGGTEASEMAKKHFLDYFLFHVVALAFKKALRQHELVIAVKNETEQPIPNVGSSRLPLPTIDNNSLHGILKEALLGAIRDIDLKFSSEAFRKKYSAGSTASVVLLLNDEELIVANVGDSKALLCAGSTMTKLNAEELTSDHHPDRDDERSRIEGAGGFVSDWDVPRVNGILALSRAIGDVFLKRYGVIAEPEVTGWRRLKNEDHYLVIASDGVFESLTSQNVCDLIKNANASGKTFSDDLTPCLPSSLANCIVMAALRKGSMDNLSAIVAPLGQAEPYLEPNDEL